MKNNIERQYLKLLKDILDTGVEKQDRTSTGTISVFGRQIRHDMKLGFPLLTTKKMYWKGVVTELLWFLMGDTNIKYLVDNDCHIWDGDCYKKYCEVAGAVEEPDYIIHVDDPNQNCTRLMTKEEFINKIKTDDEFARKWGDLGKIYGKQWRSWDIYQQSAYDTLRYNKKHPSIDQIANLINELKTNPDSRRLMVSAWNVGELDSMTLPPCHYGFQVYTRELCVEERVEVARKTLSKETFFEYGNLSPFTTPIITYWLNQYNIPTRAISLMWNQRSVDMPLGLPFNIASYALLLEIVGKMVNMVPDELIGNLGDCHVYKNQIEGVKEQLTREPHPLPKLNINTEFWPTESGECGIGPIDAQSVLDGLSNDNFCKCLIEEDLQLSNYNYHPTIKFPLSN